MRSRDMAEADFELQRIYSLLLRFLASVPICEKDISCLKIALLGGLESVAPHRHDECALSVVIFQTSSQAPLKLVAL